MKAPGYRLKNARRYSIGTNGAKMIRPRGQGWDWQYQRSLLKNREVEFGWKAKRGRGVPFIFRFL
jgi:hypothetical protein